MAYDSANSTIRRELPTGHITGAAGASMQKFHFFQKARLKNVHAIVVTAGTNALAGVDVYVGTASVGAVTFGTNVAGTVLHSGAINVTVNANDVVELKGVATHGATLVGTFNFEYEVLPDAVQS